MKKSTRNLKSHSHSQKRAPSKKSMGPLTSSQNTEFVTLYLLSLLRDGRTKLTLLGCYGVTDFHRDSATIKSRIAHEGIKFATNILPSMFSSLLKRYEHGSASFPQFKLKRGMDYPEFCSGLIRLAFGSDNRTIRYTAFDILYSLCCAFKKLKGKYPDGVLIKQFDDFLEVDKELSDIDWFEENTYFILTYARQCWREHFSALTLDDVKLRPKPGPGATNTPTRKHMRYEPHTLYEQIDNVLPYQEWFYPTPWHACLSAPKFLSLYNTRESFPVSRFKFVPKTYGKARGICIEENEMQVLQQAFRRAFQTWIAEDKHLSVCLPLDDQSVNAAIALTSSIDQKYGTIDMSEASDRISRELVSYITQDTDLHDPLMALSTRYIKPPKGDGFPTSLVRVNKYAPMGSGLCFPIMSLVHLFLIRGILFYAGKDYCDMWKQVKVYGDDIIAPSQVIELIYDYLPKFGMKLNKEKSFYKSKFRESCGVHAYEGVDVTPVYVKHNPNHDSAEAMSSSLAVEALLFQKGFYSTAKLIRSGLSKLGVDVVTPSLPSQNLALVRRTCYDISYVRERQRAVFKNKWNPDYQCYHYHVPRLEKAKVLLRMKDEIPKYLRWMWLNTTDFSTGTVSDSLGALTRCQVWVPESALFNA